MPRTGRPRSPTTLPPGSTALYPGPFHGNAPGCALSVPAVIARAVITTAYETSALLQMRAASAPTAILPSQAVMANIAASLDGGRGAARALKLCAARPYVAMAMLRRLGLAPAQIAGLTCDDLRTTQAAMRLAVPSPTTAMTAAAELARGNVGFLATPRTGNVPASRVALPLPARMLLADSALFVAQTVKPLESESWPLFVSNKGETTTARVAKFAADTFARALDELYGAGPW